MRTEPHIFKTDISCDCPDSSIHKALSRHPEIERWTVDLEDVDRVLCVFGVLTPFEIISIVSNAGHYCAELEA